MFNFPFIVFTLIFSVASIFSALDIAKYLNYLHNKIYGKDISPLKLQKVLFFLFGEWGAFVQKASDENDGKKLKEYSKYLFNEDFQSWVYGPVINEVYKHFNNEQLSEEELFNDDRKRYVGSFIKDLAQELFELSDFRLVELTHQMDCWKNKFNPEQAYHNNVMDKEEIINEFARQI